MSISKYEELRVHEICRFWEDYQAKQDRAKRPVKRDNIKPMPDTRYFIERNRCHGVKN